MSAESKSRVTRTRRAHVGTRNVVTVNVRHNTDPDSDIMALALLLGLPQRVIRVRVCVNSVAVPGHWHVLLAVVLRGTGIMMICQPDSVNGAWQCVPARAAAAIDLISFQVRDRRTPTRSDSDPGRPHGDSD